MPSAVPDQVTVRRSMSVVCAAAVSFTLYRPSPTNVAVGAVRVAPEASVTATVGIGPREDKGFGLVVQLMVSLPGVPRAEAEALVAEADTICPYSHAVRGNIDVTLGVA